MYAKIHLLWEQIGRHTEKTKATCAFVTALIKK